MPNTLIWGIQFIIIDHLAMRKEQQNFVCTSKPVLLTSKLNGENANYDQYKDALSALMDSKFDLVCQYPEQTFVDNTTLVLSLIRVETNILYK